MPPHAVAFGHLQIVALTGQSQIAFRSMRGEAHSPLLDRHGRRDVAFDFDRTSSARAETAARDGLGDAVIQQYTQAQ